ncbi:hypothetical protein R3X27_12580 [Tropicimonas sp. TH_r6]|uniref:DUF7680 family protein n=1 Tax=Tropicimonas sp. TH_r6 TaxID=3082085 RepID=UPI0029541960|nr:hypothetical protein [Tropicimonas sp. TH_r6]MDV7143516.1 hypothetical protein [Tropicimonas sp. TH_r6]
MTTKKGRSLRQEEVYKSLHAGALSSAPFALRVTQHSDVPPPVLVIKERRAREGDQEDARTGHLQDRGRLYGDALRRLLPLVKSIVAQARNENDVPLEVDIFLSIDAIKTQRTLVINEESGAKLGIIFKLQERMTDLDRVELLARRVATFSREEASYWFSRISHYGPVANRWAVSGLRIMLCGHGKGQEGDVEAALEKLRARQ